jgi:hypothetical protein
LFAFVIEQSLTPGVQLVEALFRFACQAQPFPTKLSARLEVRDKVLENELLAWNWLLRAAAWE